MELFLLWSYSCNSQIEAIIQEKEKRRSDDKLYEKIAKLVK